jgi:suppressor of fused protein SUFU
LANPTGARLFNAFKTNEEPLRPFAPGTELSCILLLEDMKVTPLQAGKNKCITFFRVIPLYTEERDLYHSAGIVALLERFQQQNISMILDPKRPNVAVL